MLCRYDILALRSLLSRGAITAVGGQIGVGKESDIFEAQDENGEEVVIKIHRLGRTSFRTVRKNRDYLGNKSKANWLYLSRLAATKEFAFMQALHAHDFPTPIPIDQNRHCVVMSRVNGFPMAQIKAGNMAGAEEIFNKCVTMLKRLAEHGLVHCDFNEFNIMTDEGGNLTMIDFPQMISTSHPNAAEFFYRDMNCLVKFFAMKMKYVAPDSSLMTLSDVCVNPEYHMYEDVQNSKGISSKEDQNLIEFISHTTELNDEMVLHAKNCDENINYKAENDNEEGDEMSGDGVKDLADPSSIFRVDMKSLSITEEDTKIPQQLSNDVLKSSSCDAIDSSQSNMNCAEGTLNCRSDNDSDNSTSDVEKDEDDVAQHRDYLIKQKVKRGKFKKHGGQKTTRNTTKQRNKYGKVDKSMRDF